MRSTLLFILQYYSNGHYSAKEDDSMNIVMVVCIFLPLILGIGYLIYTQRFNSKWNKGIFPDRLPFNRDNLLESYICLAALMIQKDRRDAAEKVQYMNSFFIKHFPNSDYNFAESLKWSFQNPVQPRTVAFWINKHLKEKTKKTQVLYFLVGMAMLDGQMIDREYAILKEILPILSFEQKDLDAIIAMYEFKKEESKKYDSENSNSQKQSSFKSTNNSARAEIAYKILGLFPTAAIQEIKAAYRSLVKIHHPDKFANESQEQINLAHERFCKIQDAYELLEKLKG